ncbi:hypothetical protein CCP3SC1_260015 [Gammaproteobacteria bacterium]
MHDLLTTFEQQGRWIDISRMCDEQLRKRPNDVTLWHRKAKALRELHDFSGAVDAYRRALIWAPQEVGLHYYLGNVLSESGNHQAATEALREAIRLKPDFVEAYNALGNNLVKQEQTDAAITTWKTATTLNPSYASAHYNLGKALGEKRLWLEAEEHLRQVITLAPDHVQAWNNLGNVLRGQYRLFEAEQCYRQALVLAPEHLDAIRNLTQLLKDSTGIGEALQLAEQVVRLAPGAATSHATYGSVLCAMRKWREATTAFERALALDPKNADSYHGLSQALAEQGNEVNALAVIHQAQKLAPMEAEHWNAEAMVQGLFGHWNEAWAAMEQALNLAPESPEVRYNHSLFLLRAGRYREGWIDYEFRKQCPSLGKQPYIKFDLIAPSWDGTPLPGKRLLIYAEQGLGDSLQFCRFLLQARERVGEISLVIQPPLQKLIGRMGTAASVGSIDRDVPNCDVVCSLVSLPRVLDIEIDDLPGPMPYLTTNPVRVAYWQNRLRPTKRPRVGLVWGGNPNHGNDHRRSLTLEILRPLINIEHIDWYSLQVGSRAAEIAACGLSDWLVDLSPELTDFDETATALCCLDLVIAPDTAIIHLAGALGCPAWVLVPDPPDWRWLNERTDSPWYPNLLLFRQAVPGEWSGVITAVVESLLAWIPFKMPATDCLTKKASLPVMESPIAQRLHPDPEPQLYRPSAGEDLAGPSPALGQWLQAQGISLALTTYQSSRLYLIGSDTQGKVSLFKRMFEPAMGLYVSGEQLWLSSRFQVWRLENVLPTGERYNDYDRLFVPRNGHTTGDLDLHDLVVDANGVVTGIATRINALVTLDERFGVSLRWQPPFIEPIKDGDCCHLNGLALRDGQPAFVTLVGTSNEPGGWRNHCSNGGQVWDLATNRPLVSGLSMPHSPRWYRDRLWLLNSGRGEFGYVDIPRARFVAVQICPGYPRGLAFWGDYAIIGLSLPRDKTFNGLPLDEILARQNLLPQCGLLVIHLGTFEVKHYLRFEGVVREVYDIQVIPGALRPMALGFQTDEIKSLITLSVEGKSHILCSPQQAEKPKEIKPPPISSTSHNTASSVFSNFPVSPDLTQLQQQVLTHPTAAGYFQLGQEFRKRQAWLGAVDAFRRALELDPGIALAQHHLGMVFLAMERKNEAEKSFEKALLIDPKLARTRSNLAQLYLSRGDVQEAVRQFEQSLADEGGFIPARLGLIESLLRQRRGNQAKKQIRLARQMLSEQPVGSLHEQLQRLVQEANRL